MDKNAEVVGSASKRRKVNGKRDKESDEEAIVIAAAPNQIEQTSELLKLPPEVFEYIFNYLPMKCLVAAGETCLSLNELAGHHFKVQIFIVHTIKISSTEKSSFMMASV